MFPKYKEESFVITALFQNGQNKSEILSEVQLGETKKNFLQMPKLEKVI